MIMSGTKSKSLAELLTLRSEWESVVADYKLSEYNGTIDNLRWYTKYGIRSNRFRPNFDHSLELAKQIVSEVNSYETTYLSSVHWEEI